MRSRRTKLFLIGGAVVTLGVLLPPIDPVAGSVHRHSRGMEVVVTSGGPETVVILPARRGQGPVPVPSMTTAPVPIRSPQPFVVYVTTVKTPPTLPAPPTASGPSRSRRRSEHQWQPPTLTAMAHRAMVTSSPDVRLLEGGFGSPRR